MRKVYVAGAYSADNFFTLLNNMRVGMKAGVKVLLAGFAPFVPWLDYQFQLMLEAGEELTLENYYTYSMSWLEVSDVIWVLPGSKDSKGTKKEIRRAKKLGIPVFYDFEEMVEYLRNMDDYDKNDPKAVEEINEAMTKAYGFPNLNGGEAEAQ